MPSHPAAPNALSILVVADPGLPTRRALSGRDDLRAELARDLDRQVEVMVESELIRTDQDDRIEIGSAQRIADRYERVDVVLVLTEMPRYTDGRPLVAGVFPEQRVAVISCPTLGAWVSADRVRSVLAACTVQMFAGDLPGKVTRRHRLRWARWHEREDGSVALASSPVAGGARLIGGMIVANEPWRTAPRLSGAFMAAFATGAFGIFYNSIWRMSDAMHPARLLLVAVAAVLSMTVWLILSNRLWDRREHSRPAAIVLLYNLSTVVTIFLAVLALYLMLLVLILIGAAAVIAPDFMSEVIGSPTGAGNYVRIAVFAAAMGVVAGALGSGFDSEADRRRITHGQRERQRRLEDDEERETGRLRRPLDAADHAEEERG